MTAAESPNGLFPSVLSDAAVESYTILLQVHFTQLIKALKISE